MIDLEFAMTYRLDVEGPVAATDGSQVSPSRQFWQMSKASLNGPRIQANSAMPGIDWFTPLGEGYGAPHVRIPFHANDGALILLEYRGIVEASPAFTTAVESDTSTQWSDQYMRMAMVFETESPQYQWLVQSLFIARGRLLGAKRLEYEVYRVR